MSTDPDTGPNDGGAQGGNVVERTLQTIVPDAIRSRFALKFALVLVIMGVILVGLGFTATDALSTQVEDDARAEYERLADQQASQIETWIERNVVSLRLASQHDALNTGREDFFQLRTALNDPFGTTYDSSGAYLISTETDLGEPAIIVEATWVDEQDPIPISETNQGWISEIDLDELSSGSVRMSDVYMVDDEPVIGFLSKVQGPHPRYLVLEFRVEDLAASISNQEEDLQRDQFSQIVNAESTIQVDTRMTDERGAHVLGTYGNSETIERAFQDGTEGARTTGVRIVEDDPSVMDEAYAVGYASVEVDEVDSNWAVVTHAPTSELFGFVQRISLWGQIITVAAAVLIALIGAAIGYSTAAAIDRLRRKVEEMEEGNLDVEINSTRIDSIGQLYDGFANMRDALREQINESEQARKEAEVARAEAMEMNEYLQSKAEEYSAIMGECAAGDLTQRMDVDGENDAMDQIATDFNGMIEELEKTTGQLKQFADEVEEAGDVVETSAESVRDASEQVAESVQRISDDAHDQQARLEELSAAIDEAIGQFEQVAAEAEVDVESSIDQLRGVADAINDLGELTDEMMAESENVAGAAEEQAAELNSVSQQARDLTRYARPLKDVLESFETEEEHEFYFPTGPGSPQGNDD